MLRLVSSNIRFSNVQDGAHSWAIRKPLLGETFRELEVDFLGTQEGRREQLLELANELPALTLVQSHRQWIDDRMYPCLFYKTDRFVLIESGDIWLSETPEEAGSSSFESSFPRLLTWARFQERETKKFFEVVNTHLDHVLKTTRQKQIEVFIHELKKRNISPQIIMGDFNEKPHEKIKTDLLKTFNLTDPWDEKKLPEETSHHGFKGINATGGDRIDWILTDSKWSCSTIYLEKKSVDGIYLSDHYPLVATVTPQY